MALRNSNWTADLSNYSIVYLDSILYFNFQELDQEEGQYVLDVAKLALSHARHLQWIIDTCQIDESQFVILYQSKDNYVAQLFVKAMIAGYVEIYENLANRMSFVHRAVPPQLIQLRDWLSSQSHLTNQRKLRNSCAHEANVVPPLHGTTEETWSVFNPRVFFESVQASMPPLIMELVLLTTNLEPELGNLRTPCRTPPDISHVVNQQLAETLLEEKNNDPQFQDLNTRLTRLRNFCAVFDIMLQKIQSGFFNLRQRQAFKWAAVFKILMARSEDKIFTVQQARNERAAEIVEARSEDQSTSWAVVPADFDWGASQATGDWSGSDWNSETAVKRAEGDSDSTLTCVEVFRIALRRASRRAPDPCTFQIQDVQDMQAYAVQVVLQ